MSQDGVAVQLRWLRVLWIIEGTFYIGQSFKANDFKEFSISNL